MVVSIAYVLACGACTASCAGYSGICKLVFEQPILVSAPTQVAVALVQTTLTTTMQYQCLHTMSAMLALPAMATIAAALPIAPACPAQYLALPAILAPRACYLR